MKKKKKQARRQYNGTFTVLKEKKANAKFNVHQKYPLKMKVK